MSGELSAEGFCKPWGRAVVPAHDCSYPPAVEVVDLLRVDFDRRAVGPDGLYLVEITSPRGVEWRGCRRFEHALSGRLRMDEDGCGAWREMPGLAAMNLRIVGYVEQVYKPSRGV